MRHRPPSVLAALALTVASTVALAFGAGAPAAGAAPPPVVRTGIQYADPDGQPQLLDVYLPGGGGGGPLPAVILVHGGGWQWGDRTNMADVAQYLAENGFVSFTIDYRLANTHRKYNPYPAAVQDVKTAIGWVRAHASEYGVDPKRLGLLGSSAGAHLASLVGMEGSGPLDGGTRVAAVVSWSGPQDMAELYRDGPPNAQAAVEAFTNCTGGPDACAAILKEISPITYVDPSDPPLFFSNGTQELVPLPQAVEMDKALTAAGVQHQFVEVPGDLHAQHYSNKTAPSLPAGQTVLEASLAWFQKWLVLGGAAATSGPTPPRAQPTGGEAGKGLGGLGRGGVPARHSSLLTVAVLAAAGLVLVVFAALFLAAALRRRARRLRREREWRAGQARSRSGSGAHGGSRSHGGSRAHGGRSQSERSGSASGRSR